MNLLKKNIWTLYLIIALTFTFLLGFSIHTKKSALFQENRNQQLYLLNVFQNNFLLDVAEQEFILDYISNQYLHEKKIDREKVSALLNKNHLLSGLKLFSSKGDVLFSSVQLSNKEKTQKVKQFVTKQNWFKQARESDQMVIGIPLLTKHNEQIWPLAKRITNAQGEIIAIVTSELNLLNIEKLWQGGRQYQSSLQVTQDKTFSSIIKINLHRQATTNNTSAYPDYISEKYNLSTGTQKKTIKSNITNDHNLLFHNKISATQFNTIVNPSSPKSQTLDTLRSSTPPLQLTVASEENGESLFMVVFNKKYNLWFSIGTNSAQLYSILNQMIYYYFTAYLVSMLIFFLLFCWVLNTEKEKSQEITYQVHHDTLTDLYNYLELEIQFNEAMKEEHTCLSLFYIDLHSFKNINDSFGYSYGDIILTEVSQRIKSALQNFPATAFRHHSDKFIILLKSNDNKVIKNLATNLLQFIAFPYVVHKNQFQINATIGIANYPDHADNIETLLTYAENSLRREKQIQNSIAFFSLEDHHRLMQKKEIEEALKHAIEKQEISLVYQPQIALNNKISGVEALVRWHSKKFGFIPPDMFIPIAEEIGFMPELGDYILRTALQEITTFHKKEKTNFTLSVNVSVKQFMQIDFLTKLLQVYNEYNTEKTSLIIEITESLFIENIKALLPTFNQLKAHNIQLSLDDFGTGYSSLSMLREVPIDELKIDKSFIDHITENESDRNMLGCIIDLGKKFNMSVLAEGVETIEQLEILRKENCDLIQGYYFSKPLTLGALTEFVRANQQAPRAKHNVRAKELLSIGS